MGQEGGSRAAMAYFLGLLPHPMQPRACALARALALARGQKTRLPCSVLQGVQGGLCMQGSQQDGRPAEFQSWLQTDAKRQNGSEREHTHSAVLTYFNP